tara:strand:- start:454 stop:765 length:312 start_codon:yes stop_codon:yes gene_type:complete
MTDIFKNVNGQRIKLTGSELTEYNNLQKAWSDGATERKKEKLRSQRKKLLEEADWQIHKIEDAGGDPSAWRTYRQALRDITNEPDKINFYKFDGDNPTWPTKP